MWVKDPQQQEEYWRRLVKVTRELRLAGPALLAADANESVTSVSDSRIRWLARVADGKCYVFAYLPAERFVEDPSAAERTEVRFTLANGQTITRTFRPDFADWFAVSFPLVKGNGSSTWACAWSAKRSSLHAHNVSCDRRPRTWRKY